MRRALRGSSFGYEHDQLNNFDQIGGRMRDIWLRPNGTGEDQFTYTLNPGIYAAGPNGQPNRGRGDDIRVGDLTSADLEWTPASGRRRATLWPTSTKT